MKERKTYAVDFGDGEIMQHFESDLCGFDEMGKDFKIIGRVCDDQKFGDRCSTDCIHYAQGTCPAEIMTDSLTGDFIHVLK